MTVGDRLSLALTLLQAPIVALIVLLGFVNKPYDQTILAPRPLKNTERVIGQVVYQLMPPGHWADVVRAMTESDGPVLPDKLIPDPRFNYMLLFLLVIIVMWLGCNNAAKEIVKEEAVYSRERAINLGIGPYLASKFLVQSVLSAAQAGVLLVCVMGALELFAVVFGHQAPDAGYRLPEAELLGVLALGATAGVALGLVLSACVSSPDRANTLLPYVLIPQIILGGGIMPIKSGVLYWIAAVLSPVYWGFRAVRTGETELPKDLPLHMNYDDSLWIPCAALAAQTAILLAVAAWCLWRKDRTAG